MPYIIVKEKQPLDFVVRRFRRICERDGIYKTKSFIEYFKKPSEIRKIQKATGKKRAYRRMLRENSTTLTTQKASPVKKRRYGA